MFQNTLVEKNQPNVKKPLIVLVLLQVIKHLYSHIECSYQLSRFELALLPFQERFFDLLIRSANMCVAICLIAMQHTSEYNLDLLVDL